MSAQIQSWCLNSELQTLAWARQLSTCALPGMVIYLQGELGAGKTTFTRGFLQGLGYQGRVKSPTFTLLEPYHLQTPHGELWVYHFDLYRLTTPEALYDIGFADYVHERGICIIEWPEKAQTLLPPPAWSIYLSPLAGPNDEQMRQLSFTSQCSQQVLRVLQAMAMFKQDNINVIKNA